MADGLIDSHGDSPNPTGYIVATIRGRIMLGIRKDSLFSVSPTTYKKKGGDIPCIMLSENLQKTVNGHAAREVELETESLTHIVYEQACQNEREREIIRLRADDQSDEEIGKQLGVTKQRIHQIRLQVVNRIKTLLQV